VYWIRPHPQAQDAISALPDAALESYAKVLGLLKVAPWGGDPIREDNPDANILTVPFGPGGMVTYMILDREQEVHIIEVLWAG
jgi:hypothetical protein